MKVKIQTMLGDIVVRLYDETPIHRDNFMKLAKEGYYDGTKPMAEAGFKMICAHCDSPTFRIIPNAEMLCEGGIVKLNTEMYGGPIMSTPPMRRWHPSLCLLFS